MGYISPIESYLPNFNSNMFQSSLLSPFQGESTDQYWNNELAAYNQDRFKLETPQLNPFQQQQYNPFANVMTDYAQQFKNNTQASMQDINLMTGLTLQNSSDPTAQLLGQQMILDNTALGTTPKQATQTPDVSHLTGADINYGQQFMQAGTQLAGQLTSQIGGKGGQIASNAVKAVSSIYNAVSNIKEISTAAKAGVEGLGKAKAGNAMAIVGAVSDLAGSFLPEKTEYNGPKGDITQTMDSVYDGISDAAMSLGPIGMIVGGAMKGGKLLGGVMNSIGGGTDGMTTTDAILGSSFLNLTPIGLINGFGGQKADTITKNEEAFETVGASYTGSNQSINSALQKSGKKYGLLSNSAREKANEEILKARLQQDIITDIADQATDRFAIRNSMAAINGNRRSFAMRGGYNQAAIQFGQNGMVIAKRVASQRKMNKRRQEIKKVDPFEVYLQSLPENQRDTVNYRARDYWEFNGRPKNFREAIAKGMFTFEDDGLWHAKSVSENPNTGEIEFMKPDTHPTHQLEIDWYNSDDGAQFRQEYELVKSSPYWKYIKRKNPQEFKEGGAFNNDSVLMEIELDSSPEEFKEGGKIDNVSVLVEVDIDSLPEEFKDGGILGTSTIKEIEIEETVEEFKEGGAFNVIPEGALHARLHHMENSENLTKKGIPVVSEGEGGELEQHAEIEKEEIILRLSLTKRLEELAKEDTDEAALEAGKILVEEILNNTVDNTNTLL